MPTGSPHSANVVDTFVNDQVDGALALVPPWQALQRDIRQRYDTSAHGDYARWAAALEQLLSGHVTTDVLQALHPWRKGPMQIADIEIDTEWRSDWKWQRIRELLSWKDALVLDVGCGNGYFGWQMLREGARGVVGIDPTLLFCMQHLAAASQRGRAANFVLPLRMEEVPAAPVFDAVLSMGVAYHRKEPLAHVQALSAMAKPGAHVLLETLVVEDTAPLYPEGRYANMRNVSVVPTPELAASWLAEAGLTNVVCRDVSPTTLEEQRATPWMRFHSLIDALDANDRSRTVEGHPAPVRAVLTATKPA